MNGMIYVGHIGIFLLAGTTLLLVWEGGVVDSAEAMCSLTSGACVGYAAANLRRLRTKQPGSGDGA